MDWRSIKFDWNRARAFLVTVEEGSLSAAARALDLTQPTLGRQVSALEEELDTVLFERVGKKLQLTPSGLELVEHVRAMGEAATHVSLTASGQAQSVEGSIRLTASEAFSAFVLPPIIDELRAAEPGICVEIVASNDLRDLRRREADIAIRNARPTDPDLVAKKIRDDTAALYATNRYLESCGDLHLRENIERAHLIGFEDNQPFLEGLLARDLDLTRANFPVIANSHLVHWELVKAGLGVGVMATRIGDPDQVVRRALPWLKPFTFPIWLVAHREVATSRRIRIVYDLLADALHRM
ncbi:MAG: LysR family transcriptional regulator [Hyphomicrobiaceae bacterium]